MKIRGLLLIPTLVVSALLSVASRLRRSQSARVQSVSSPGSPFAVTPTPDGQYAFVAQPSGATSGIAIITGPSSDSLVRILPTGGETWASRSPGRQVLAGQVVICW